jgi:hypothetical protein
MMFLSLVRRGFAVLAECLAASVPAQKRAPVRVITRNGSMSHKRMAK